MANRITLEYFGRVDDAGAIALPKRMRKEISKAFAGKKIRVLVEQARKERSSEQNRYYWGVVIPCVLQGFIDAGNDLQTANPEHAELIHEYLKARFAPPLLAVDAHGEEHRMPPTTTAMTTSEFMDYLAQVQRFAAEYLNTTIPEPNEQLSIF